MTDLDRRLREADPYQRADLDGADTALLEEIVRQSPVDPAVRSRIRRLRRGRATLRSRLAISMATAAAVTAAIAVPVVIAGQDGGTPPQAGSTPSPDDTEVVTPVRYAAAAIKVAKSNPRVLVTAPGWKVRSLGGFSPTSGEMTFQHGPDRYRKEPIYGGKMARSADGLPVPAGGDEQIIGYSRVNDAPHLSVDWYPRSSYDGYLDDRSDEPDSRWVTVDGKRARLVNYSADDHAVLLAPQGDVFLELRGHNLGDEAAFLEFLAEHVEQVDVPTWLAALPSEMVVAGGAQQAMTRILADIPTPPGLDRDVLGEAQALDSYQLGATVTGAVACGWIQEWERARAAGDDAAVKSAADALATSHDWKVLHEMDAEGDYPEVVWEYADQVAAGQEPQGYRGGLGCR